MLKIDSIEKKFGRKLVLDKISFSLQPGKIYGLIGVNGAGKSTLMKILVGLTSPNGGEILIDGKPFKKEEWRLGFTIEDPCFYPNLTGRENLLLIAKLFDDVKDGDVDLALEKVGLTSRAKDPYKTYSLGMKHRLYFALAIMSNPQILILDEPFNGVDPMTLVVFENIVRDFAKSGAYVLISSHEIRELQALADGAFIMASGKIGFQTENVRDVDLFEKFLELEKNNGGVSRP